MVPTMLWLSAVLIATVSNLDNLGVGTAFGMRDTPVSALANLIIAAVTMAATAIAMTFGRALSQLIAPSIGSALGSAIIIAVGAGTVTDLDPHHPHTRALADPGRHAPNPTRSTGLRSPLAKRSCSASRSR